VLTTTHKELKEDPELVKAMVEATTRGYEFTESQPQKALDDLLEANKSLERADQAAQLKVLLPALKPAPFKDAVLTEWSAWASSHGLLRMPLDVYRAFVVVPVRPKN
jgi:ABC-type nitrate/sulfonate/bicarbonate transport system substrate-binding protein